MKISKQQLKKMIKEEKNKLLLKESRGTMADIFAEAADALNQRDGEAIDRIIQSMQGLLSSDSSQWISALEAMSYAAYELADYENEEY